MHGYGGRADHGDAHDLRERVVDVAEFARWYVRGKFRMMESLLPDLERRAHGAGREALRRDVLTTLRHAERVTLARAIVTVLLFLAGASTVVSTIGAFLDPLPHVRTAVETVAALAAAATFVLILARLAFDRYLDLVTVCATFLAMRLAAGAGAEAPG